MTPYNATGGRLSPDDSWLAFESDETGQRNVYLQPFPGPGAKVRVSASGGRMPAWSRNGKELFYWERAGLIAVDVRLGPQIALGAHHALFQANLEPFLSELAMYDPAPDGQRFVVDAVPGSSSRLAVIPNLFANIQR
jgi:serine/threonine-protein kinase